MGMIKEQRMRISGFSRHALLCCVAAAMLAGCGGSQPPIGVPDAMPELETAPGHIVAHHIGAPSSFHVLHSFGPLPDGAQPYAGLIDVKGTLYGTTFTGGSNGCGTGYICGTVFSITTTGVEQVLYNFTGSSGEYPMAGLIDVNGTLYGTTFGGGMYDAGTVFTISTAGAEQALYSFTGGSDGSLPTT